MQLKKRLIQHKHMKMLSICMSTRLSPTDKNTLLQRKLKLFDSTWKITPCLQLLLEKANNKIPSPYSIRNVFSSGPILSIPLYKAMGWLIGNLQRVLPKYPLFLSSPRELSSSLNNLHNHSCLLCSQSRAWRVPAGIILYFHSPYVAEHTDNSLGHEHKATPRSCWKSTDVWTCMHVCVPMYVMESERTPTLTYYKPAKKEPWARGNGIVNWRVKMGSFSYKTSISKMHK